MDHYPEFRKTSHTLTPGLNPCAQFLVSISGKKILIIFFLNFRKNIFIFFLNFRKELVSGLRHRRADRGEPIQRNRIRERLDASLRRSGTETL